MAGSGIAVGIGKGHTVTSKDKALKPSTRKGVSPARARCASLPLRLKYCAPAGLQPPPAAPPRALPAPRTITYPARRRQRGMQAASENDYLWTMRAGCLRWG